jgi:catechol 1,2-dioxygenase
MSTQPNSQQPLKNGEQNDVTVGAKATGFDANLTSQVIGATGPKANPRLALILPNLIRHLHDFMRESAITSEELMSAFDLVGSIQVHADGAQDLTGFS